MKHDWTTLSMLAGTGIVFILISSYTFLIRVRFHASGEVNKYKDQICETEALLKLEICLGIERNDISEFIIRQWSHRALLPLWTDFLGETYYASCLNIFFHSCVTFLKTLFSNCTECLDTKAVLWGNFYTPPYLILGLEAVITFPCHFAYPISRLSTSSCADL